MCLSRPRRLIRVCVNGKIEYAYPDTGSDPDLMTPAYAIQHNLVIEPLELDDEGKVQLANGSVVKLLGKTRVPLNISGDNSGSLVDDGSLQTFYLMEDLATNILLSSNTLFELNAFTEHEDAFIYVHNDNALSDMNSVVWFDERGRRTIDALSFFSSSQSR